MLSSVHTAATRRGPHTTAGVPVVPDAVGLEFFHPQFSAEFPLKSLARPVDVGRRTAFALTTGVNIYAAEAALSVASIDLNLVRSLRQAIAAADATGREAAAPTTAVNDPAAGYSVHAQYGYRSQGPAAYYDGVRGVGADCSSHRLDGWRPYGRLGCGAGVRRFDPSVAPPPPTDYHSSVQPPWKVLPRPELGSVPATGFAVDRRVMLPPPRFDVGNVGRTLDLFV